MTLSNSPLVQVASCDRFDRPHLHVVDSFGKQHCEQPLFVLENQANLLSPSSKSRPLTSSETKPVTLMPSSKKKTSGTESPKPTKVAKAQPNQSITEKAQEANAGGASHRGVASLTWNYAVIFPAALREHLPFKYVGKANRVKIQVDIVGDTVVLSRYTPPTTKPK